MIFNQHLGLQGKHAFLSPSSYHWLNYDEQKLEARFHSFRAAKRGTDLHLYAHEAIRLGMKQHRVHQALAAYVNDAIAYDMLCEQPLYYSDNCFGTADTLCFRRKKLRIHDLKTGITATSMKQLYVYAAIFCLEYGADPFEIDIVLRIYQRDDIREDLPDPNEILSIMDKIIYADAYIERLKEAA